MSERRASCIHAIHITIYASSTSWCDTVMDNLCVYLGSFTARNQGRCGSQMRDLHYFNWHEKRVDIRLSRIDIVATGNIDSYSSIRAVRTALAFGLILRQYGLVIFSAQHTHGYDDILGICGMGVHEPGTTPVWATLCLVIRRADFLIGMSYCRLDVFCPAQFAVTRLFL